jgi:hypothetical protein
MERGDKKRVREEQKTERIEKSRRKGRKMEYEERVREKRKTERREKRRRKGRKMENKERQRKEEIELVELIEWKLK